MWLEQPGRGGKAKVGLGPTGSRFWSLCVRIGLGQSRGVCGGVFLNEIANDLGVGVRLALVVLFCFVCLFLGPHQWHMKVPKLGVQLEL